MSHVKEGHPFHHERLDNLSAREEIIQRTVEKERRTTFSEAACLYRKAVGWSILLSTAVIMEGYDLLLVTSFFAFQPWAKKYGEPLPNGTYELPAAWQTGLYNGAAVGEIIGLFLNGYLVERLGYRKTMMGALGLITALIFIPFFAPSVQVLQVGSILMGIPWGVFQTLPATYASEVCPVALRGYLTTYINICWVTGQLLASGVLRALLKRSDQWAYRIPYGLQWMWPAPLIIGVALAPESPWWFVRHGKKDSAKASLRRLTVPSADPEFSIDDTVEVMAYTNEIEQEMSQGTALVDCFKGYNLRRTEICCLTWAAQQLCGTPFMNNSTYFFIQAGLDESNSFNMSMAQYAIGFVGVLGAWGLMRHAGRRTLYLAGLAILDLLLLGIGLTSIRARSSGAQWAAGSLLLIFALCYNFTVGTVCYSIVSEVSAVRLRPKTVSLARNVYNVASIISGVITPYMLNPTAWNWKSRAGFFWAGICFLCLSWAFFRLPETKGRTYAELDILFERRISARKFASTSVDLFYHSENTEGNGKTE
ncbi:general substrate transporter [Aspergillus avenaceus]|uniref:General substrate transporter n=1 Tax=Aspergillus avenaceus TaxID=36643 RepID=A0A5N6TQT3_ASPAV|nr:general substrate transporter [Aspergillus avenaceus]